MIVKKGMTAKSLGLTLYIRKSRCIMAKRMNEDFSIETLKGWEHCKKGAWLVLLDNTLWEAIDHEEFIRIYWRCDPRTDCAGPCDEATS